MVKRKKIAVIGAGVSGLAAAKAFVERGHDVVGFERGPELGGVWEPSRSYSGVCTQSDKDLYAYTDKPMPADYPRWPSGGQVRNYLGNYASDHDLQRLYSFNTNVISAKPKKNGNWSVSIEVDGKQKTMTFDFVAICTGQFSDAKRLDLPGRSAFTNGGGTLMHSHEYTDPTLAKDKRVVVIGGSKSATDIAVSAWKNGAKSVSMVYRRDVWRVPYKVLGLINFKHLVFMRLQEHFFGGWSQSPAIKAISKITKPVGWANFRALELVLKAQLRLKKFDMVPTDRIEDVVACTFPVVTPGFYEGISKGNINPVRNSPASLGKEKLTLADGRTLDADLVIEAVGWEQNIPFLPKDARNRLIAPDGQFRLYRHAVNPDLPGLGLVGFNTSFATILTSELIANWLVRFADGQLIDQPDDDTMRDSIRVLEEWRKNERPAALAYGGLCVAPFHYRHMDELLADMGAAKRSSANPLTEYLSYPRAGKFRAYLDSAPQYVAG